MCAWHGSPLGHVPTFPREQGAACHMAAAYIYVTAAACQRASRLGREPFVKAAVMKVLAALASPEVPPAHPRQTPRKSPQVDTAVQPLLGQSKPQMGKGTQR